MTGFKEAAGLCCVKTQKIDQIRKFEGVQNVEFREELYIFFSFEMYIAETHRMEITVNALFACFVFISDHGGSPDESYHSRHKH